MRKRSARIEALLGELMPLAHIVPDTLQPGPEMSRLLDLLYGVLVDQDSHALLAIFETLRADGLTAVWEYLWDRALDMACIKGYEDGSQSILIAVPFLAPWTGECRGADRKALTQALKKHEVIPKRGKIHWVQKPQSIYALRDTSPSLLWMLNTPYATDPHTWNYGHTTAPTMYLLVGRLEFSAQHLPFWPNPDVLIQAQAEALGWPQEALDACAPLRWFLEREIEEPDSAEDRMMEMILAAVSAAKNWIEETKVNAEDCQILVHDGADATLHVFIQPKGWGKHLLCGLDYEAAQVPRDQILGKFREVFEQFGFAVGMDRPPGETRATFH